jgi:Tol biopolymer transport system component
MGLMAHRASGESPARRITLADWYRITSLAWINHGRALLLEGQEMPNAEYQIWKVSYPEGRAERITADLNSYHGLSVSNDSKVLVAVRKESQWQIFVLQTGSGTSEENMQPVTGAGPSADGADGLAFSGDGRLVFSSHASGMNELWIMDADGSHKEQITKNDARNFRASLSRDGRILVCVSTRGGGHDIWRMSSDGTNARQLTRSGADSEATVSPDGTWIAYMSIGEGRRRLRRMDIDGNHQINLSDQPMLPLAPVISPDGRRIAFLTYNPVEHSDQIVVIPSGGGEPIKTANVPGFCPLQWTPAGDEVAYVRGENGAQNIWAEPLAGGAARQITHFRQGAIDRFAWSRSGKQLAIVRRSSTGDVVLIRPVR